VILSTSETPYPWKQYGQDLNISPEMHPKSVFQLQGGCYKFLGSRPNRASFHSSVHKLKISDTVAEVCEAPCNYGPPKTKEADPWRTYAEIMTCPSSGCNPDLLSKAFDSYVDNLKEKTQFYTKSKEIGPLNQIETVSGIDGERFIDAMKMKTAAGVPLKGKKESLVVELPPTKEHACPRTFVDEVWEEVKQVKEALLKGERAWTIAKGSLKDEPVKVSKVKQRIFEGAPLACQLLVRQLFLPLCRMLSIVPLASECGVGINPYSPEWEQMINHVAEFGHDRIVAGDFSKYDVTLPAQFTFAAFRVFIEMSKWCSGYTDEDRELMAALATEICYPIIDFNGDLVEFHGINPSGNNLTVYINGIVNSLIHRCAFFNLFPNLSFEDFVRLMTYGDDSIGSSKLDEYNHISVAKFCASMQLVMTMPDKSSEPRAFMNLDEVDFLKMKSTYQEDLDCTTGALDEDSIFKSLHVGMKSQLTPDEQCACNIDGALLEWFFHGREVYELRRQQMKEVAEKHGLTGWCSRLDKPYDDMVVWWKGRYS
jgi:hypothetical protein